MHRLMFLVLSVLLPVTIAAQPADLSGDWQVTQHSFGATRYALLHVDQSGDSLEPGNPEQEEPGGSKGKMPGKGPSQQPAGDPTPRLGAKGYDSALEGDPGRGKRDSIDTNMFGQAAKVPSRLQSGDAFEQYRKMMEEAIAREQVPRDYQPQVKDYFRALGEK